MYQVRSRPVGIPVSKPGAWKIPLSEEANRRLLGEGNEIQMSSRHTYERPDIGGRMCERRLVVVFLRMLAKKIRYGVERTLLPIALCLAVDVHGETGP